MLEKWSCDINSLIVCDNVFCLSSISFLFASLSLVFCIILGLSASFILGCLIFLKINVLVSSFSNASASFCLFDILLLSMGVISGCFLGLVLLDVVGISCNSFKFFYFI